MCVCRDISHVNTCKLYHNSSLFIPSAIFASHSTVAINQVYEQIIRMYLMFLISPYINISCIQFQEQKKKAQPVIYALFVMQTYIIPRTYQFIFSTSKLSIIDAFRDSHKHVQITNVSIFTEIFFPKKIIRSQKGVYKIFKGEKK